MKRKEKRKDSEIAGRAAEVEGDHALVLVPDVHHPIQLLLAALHGEPAQQVSCCGECRKFADTLVWYHAGRWLCFGIHHPAKNLEEGRAIPETA